MNESIGSIIMRLRKEHGMTQEQLANALGITFQAVSKWENGISSPDLSTLPLLADLFSVSVDQLLGRQPLELSNEETQEDPTADAQLLPVGVETALEPVPAPVLAESIPGDFPWPDDDTFYAVLFHGHELVGYLAGDAKLEQAKKHFVFEYEGEAQNIHSDFSVEIDGDVGGNVSAGESVSCGDVGGSVDAGTVVNCGEVDGDVIAGAGIDCGDVSGNLNAGGSVSCGDVEGNVKAGGNVKTGDVDGSVSAGGSVNCDDVGGNVRAGVSVYCEEAEGHTRGRASFSVDEDEEDGDGFNFSFDMGDFGEQLGKRISEAVEKATRFGMRFQKKWQNRPDEEEDEK